MLTASGVTPLPSRSPLHEDATQNIAAKGALNKLQIRREEFTAWLHRGVETAFRKDYEMMNESRL